MKNVLITGGTKGLGKALAFEMGHAGYHVAALYRIDDEAADLSQKQFEAAGLSAEVIRQDLTLPSAGPALKNLIREREGQWSLVHCATAPFEPLPLRQTSWESLIGQFATSVWGLELCTRLLMPRFVESGGTVVSISSDVLRHPQQGFAAYAACKSALAGWSRCAAQELNPLAVKIFTVSPGYLETGLTRSWSPDLKNHASVGGTPTTVARKIFSRFEDPMLTGLGEDYVV